MASRTGLPFFYFPFPMKQAAVSISIKSAPGNTMMGPAECRIYLVRHGETVNAKEKALNGHFDVELSPRGEEQISAVAEALKDRPIRSVYSSDLKRTRRSAEIIAHPHKLKPVCFPELRELCFGKWEGLSLLELNRKYPGEIEKRFKNPDTFQAEGGETLSQLQERVLPRFHEIVKCHPADEIVIMGHGGVNRIIMGHLLGIPLSKAFRIGQEYAGINIIQFYQSQPVIELING